MRHIKGRETVTILRSIFPGVMNEYGVSVPMITEIEVNRALVGYGTTAETNTLTAETFHHVATLFLPEGTLIKSGDRFRLEDGTIWEMQGTVLPWKKPAGFRNKIRTVVEITRVEG